MSSHMEPHTLTTAPRATHPSRRRIWFAVFVGPLAWSADFALSYAMTSYACSVQSTALLLAFSTVAFGASLAGLVVALRARRDTVDSGSATTGGFLAIAGVVSSTGFLVAIVAAAIPRLLMHPCL